MGRDRRRRWSLRWRITACALTVVVVALLGSGWALISLLGHEMTSQIDSTVTTSYQFVVQSLVKGSPLPAVGPTDVYVQFIADDGRVIASSAAARGLPPLVQPHYSTKAQILTVHDHRLGDLRVKAGASPTNHSVTLAVARSESTVSQVRSVLVPLLIGMLAAGTALLGVLTWAVIGSALRPVEIMGQTVGDISDRDLHRRLEKPGTGDELDRLAATLNDLLDRLDQAVARERRFVADASHELRTPIAGVRALLETEPVDPSSVVETRTRALAELGRLQGLVEELLLLAKADEGMAGVIREPIDLDELVIEQARQLEHTTHLRVDTSSVSGGQVCGRDIDLTHVVENLSANATRYAKTTVAFSVRQIGDDVELTVTDDGPGIALADRNRIFERFSTIGDGRFSTRQTAGLGLSIASSIVTLHQGSIRVEDAPTGGARFVVLLPAYVVSNGGADRTV